jgi:hypothetical protein
MKIIYNKDTSVVEGFVNIGTTKEPFIEAQDFIFEHELNEYQVINGEVVHVGKTEEQLQKETQEKLQIIMNAIQIMLDTTAKENGNWDNMMSARASAKPILETDSIKAKAMKDNANALEAYYFEVWGKAYAIEAEVKEGTRPMPTTDEVLAELPEFVL